MKQTMNEYISKIILFTVDITAIFISLLLTSYLVLNINMIDNSNNNEQLLMKAHTAGTVAASGGEGLITRQRLIAIVIVIVIVTVIVLVLVLVLVLVIVNTPPPMNVYSV